MDCERAKLEKGRPTADYSNDACLFHKHSLRKRVPTVHGREDSLNRVPTVRTETFNDRTGKS